LNEVVQGFPFLAEQLLGPGNQRIELGLTLLPGDGVGTFGIGQTRQAFADVGERSQVTARMRHQQLPGHVANILALVGARGEWHAVRPA